MTHFGKNFESRVDLLRKIEAQKQIVNNNVQSLQKSISDKGEEIKCELNQLYIDGEAANEQMEAMVKLKEFTLENKNLGTMYFKENMTETQSNIEGLQSQFDTLASYKPQVICEKETFEAVIEEGFRLKPHSEENYKNKRDIIWEKIKKGSLRTQLNAPNSLDIDKTNNFVYIADTKNCRIQIFTEKGDHFSAILLPENFFPLKVRILPLAVFIYIYGKRSDKFYLGVCGRNLGCVPDNNGFEYFESIPELVSFDISDMSNHRSGIFAPFRGFMSTQTRFLGYLDNEYHVVLDFPCSIGGHGSFGGIGGTTGGIGFGGTTSGLGLGGTTVGLGATSGLGTVPNLSDGTTSGNTAGGLTFGGTTSSGGGPSLFSNTTSGFGSATGNTSGGTSLLGGTTSVPSFGGTTSSGGGPSLFSNTTSGFGSATGNTGGGTSLLGGTTSVPSFGGTTSSGGGPSLFSNTTSGFGSATGNTGGGTSLLGGTTSVPSFGGTGGSGGATGGFGGGTGQSFSPFAQTTQKQFAGFSNPIHKNYIYLKSIYLEDNTQALDLQSLHSPSHNALLFVLYRYCQFAVLVFNTEGICLRGLVEIDVCNIPYVFSVDYQANIILLTGKQKEKSNKIKLDADEVKESELLVYSQGKEDLLSSLTLHEDPEGVADICSDSVFDVVLVFNDGTEEGWMIRKY